MPGLDIATVIFVVVPDTENTKLAARGNGKTTTVHKEIPNILSPTKQNPTGDVKQLPQSAKQPTPRSIGTHDNPAYDARDTTPAILCRFLLGLVFVLVILRLRCWY